MQDMFYYALQFQRDISNWDVRQVTNMEHIFDGAINFDRQQTSR